MAIDESVVKHVAKLSRLKLTDEEVAYYQNHLNVIFSYVEKVKSLEADLDPNWRPDIADDAVTPERKDAVRESLTPDEFLSQAPQKIGTAFKVPKILDS